MFFRNKLIMSIMLILIVIGGIMFMFNSMDVFGQNDNRKVIEDSSFTNIEVLTDNADVVLEPTKSSKVTVEYTGASKKAKYKFDAKLQNDTLFVQLEKKRRFFFSFGFNPSDLKLTISVPEKQYGNLQVESDNGRINIEELNSEHVYLETDNGQIQVRNIEAKTVDVETDNGKVILDHVEGDINGATDNGRILLQTDKINWPIDLSTDNGSIEIKTKSEPTNATIDAKVGNGKVTIYGEDTKHKTYGKGTFIIKLQTDNGRITVTK